MIPDFTPTTREFTKEQIATSLARATDDLVYTSTRETPAGQAAVNRALLRINAIRRDLCGGFPPQTSSGILAADRNLRGAGYDAAGTYQEA